MTKRTGCIAIVGGGLIVVVALCVAGYGILQSGGKSAGERVQAIRERGEPTSLAELREFYGPLDEPNAANIYREAASQLEELTQDERSLFEERILPSDESVFPVDAPGLSAEAEPLVVALLDKTADTHALVADGVAIGAARFPIGVDVGFELLLADVQRIRLLVRLLAFHAEANAHLRNPEAAADSLVLGFGVVESMNGVPILISYMSQVALVRLLIEEFARVVSLIPLPADDLDRIERAISQCYSSESPRQALIGERAIMLDPNLREISDSLFLRWDFRSLLENYGAMIDATRKEPHEFVTVLERYDDPDSYGATPTFLHPLTTMTMPVIGGSLESHPRVRTLQSLASLICDIERFRERTGAMPRDLSEAVPEVPRDPYRDEPLLYLKEAEGYIVFSAGTFRPNMPIELRVDR